MAFLRSQISFEIYFFLQGLYLGANTMIPAPNQANPLISGLIADTVTIQIHSDSGNHDSLNAWIGSLSVNGLAQSKFPSQFLNRNVYLSLHHRNSIETWSSSAVPLLSNGSYIFHNASSKAYGGNMADLGNGVWGLYSGDINQDGSIDFLDYPQLDTDALNGELGYLSSDLNGDASVDFLDYPSIDLNSLNGIITIRP